MMPIISPLRACLARFARCESGLTSIEFVIVFPVFVTFFLMTYESGVISARHVMLEHGVDVAVRDVRIGKLEEPTLASLRERICAHALIIPSCESQLQLEMIRRDLRDWTNIPSRIRCIDRSADSQPAVEFTVGGNNELIVLRACVRIDPMLPTTGLGKAIVDNNAGGAADGSYALVATSAFVVEPFQAED